MSNNILISTVYGGSIYVETTTVFNPQGSDVNARVCPV